MTSAVMSAASAGRLETADTLPSGPVTHQARFWRSPFAMAAAAVLVFQTLLLTLATLNGQSFPYDVTVALTALSATLLSAGIWPNWNYLRVTPEGLDQQAGLRSVTVAWGDVQNVRCFDGWAELRVVTGEVGSRKVKTRVVFNRYDLSAEAFCDLIEDSWLTARHRER